MVGAAGFELATYWSQTSCATRLRYAPKDGIVLATHGGSSMIGDDFFRSRQHELPRDIHALLNMLLADESEG
jgi:hypothetical protein